MNARQGWEMGVGMGMEMDPASTWRGVLSFEEMGRGRGRGLPALEMPGCPRAAQPSVRVTPATRWFSGPCPRPNPGAAAMARCT